MKKFSDYELVWKDLIAIFVSMIIIYLIYTRNVLGLIFASITTLICLAIYINYEVMIKYHKKKNKLEIRHLFFVSSTSAIAMILLFPFYFMNYTSFDIHLTFGISMLIAMTTFAWSTIELIREESK